MKRNPQIKGAPPRKKKKKGQPKKFSTNLTAAMGNEILALNGGVPFESIIDAHEFVQGILELDPEDVEEVTPSLVRYWRTLLSRLARSPYDIEGPIAAQIIKDLQFSLNEATFFSSNFVAHSQPVFRLGSNLATMLALTEYDGDMEEIRLPFPALKIKLDPGSGLSLVDENGTEDPIKELEVMQSDDMDIISFYVVANKNFVDPAISWSPLTGKVAGGGSRDLFGEVVSDRSRYTLTELVPNLLTNFSLYIQMKQDAGEIVTEGPKRRRPNQSGETVFPIGREIKLPGQLRSVYSMDIEGDDEERWKIRNRFMVRGHWKKQPYGPGGSLRKRIWVKPYWKGPTTGAELKRIYGVD